MVLLPKPAGSRSDLVCSPFVPLAPVGDLDELVASPIGRCVVGATFATWCYAPDLHGSTLWGEVDEWSLRDLMAASRFVHHPAMSRRRRVLTDCRDLERIDADVLLELIASARDELVAWARGVERQALVVPDGPVGIIVSGALAMAGLGHAFRVMTDVNAALAFLEHPAATPAHAAATSVIEATRGPSALLSRLRALLGRRLDDATLDDAARELRMSTRTLQRELKLLGTSFTEQLHRVRLAAAEALLIHTDLKIAAIATQVGYGSASRMSATLRRERSVTAGELRAARRLPRVT